MEIDSDTAISAVSEDFYWDTFSKYICKLVPSELIVVRYTGTKSKPLGYFTVRVKFGEEIKDIDFYVLRKGGPYGVSPAAAFFKR